MSNAASSFGPRDVDRILVLCKQATPHRDRVAAVLSEWYHHGPRLAELLEAGWLKPCIGNKQLLRQPPMSLAEQDARVAAYEAQTQATQPDASAHPFSIYRGGIHITSPTGITTPAAVFAELTSDRHRLKTEALRAAPPAQKAGLKSKLDYVTPAGIFNRRANRGLITPSGLVVLDFDHLRDLRMARQALLTDKVLASELVLLFDSPSGDGIKAFVRTDPDATHLESFLAYSDYLTGHYASLGLKPDVQGKDIARACFLPFSPDAWLAPAYA